MRKEQKSISKSIIAFFLCFLMVFHTIANPIVTYAADYVDKPVNFRNWNTVKQSPINLTNTTYYNISDMTTYGTNGTVDSYGYDGTGSAAKRTFNDMHIQTKSRVVYQKIFTVASGMTLNLVAGADSGENTTNAQNLAWSVEEWDENGNFIWDSGWLYTYQSYTIGSTTQGDTLNIPVGDLPSRSKVKYITIVFRRTTDDGLVNGGGNNANITATDLANMFPNLYICAKPFAYTISNNGSTSTVNRIGTTAITPLTTPSRTGYTFNGWSVSSGSTLTPNWMHGNTYTTDQLNTYMSNGKLYNSLFGNVTFTASYSPNIYTITLNNQSATSAGSTAYYEKYNTGNYSNANCTTAISTITKPTRTGYTFGGYFTGTGGSGTQYINASGGISATKTTFTKDTTLYAKWTINSYTIRYNANGGSGSMSDTSTTYGTQTTLRANAFTRSGYTFKGWATTSGGAVTYANGAKVTSLSSTNGAVVNLYAVWEKNSYTVTYNANGGATSATSKSVAYGGAVDLSPTANKTGYTFIGWSTSSTSRIPLSSYSMPAGNVTLYAVYSIKVSDIQNHDYPTYTGTPNVSTDEVYLLVWITASPSVYKYYPLTYSQDVNTMVYRYTLPTTDISSFVNGRAYSYQLVVYDNAGNYTVLYKGGGAGDIQPEVIVKPEYTQTVNHYTYNPIKNTYNSVPFLITKTDVKEGSTFTPSYATPPTGYSAYSKDAGKAVISANTYSAYYRPNTYTITFNANGGMVTPATQTVTYDNYYPTLPTPIRTGYTFLGWNTMQNGTGTTVNDGDIYTTAGNQTLYAQWKANVYEIKLDGQGAENPGTTVYYEKYDTGNFTTSTCSISISTITVPTKTGYTFGGYYTDRGGQGTQYVDASGNILSTKTTFTANMTLYAKWTANTYTVKFNANGGTGDMADMTVTYDTTVKLSSNLFERTGYTFAGWATSADEDVVYNDKQSVTNLSAVNGAVVNLYAVWDINSYEVTYDYWTNGGIGAEEDKVMVNYNAPIDLNVPAEKCDGFTFVGWNTDASATTGLSILSMGTENVTLYAIYKKEIIVTLTERNQEDTIDTVLSKTIYNNENQADFLIVENGALSGWNNNGWSDATEATAQAITSTGATFTTKDSIRLYALYISDVTVSYDTNGSIVEYENVTMERFHNASGDYFYPLFDIEKAPEMTEHSFVMWEATDGAIYNANVPAEIKETTVLKAVWDQFPYIEAYDRYFTLEQAQSGYITHEELLGKVTAADREDGTLVKGTEVIVKDYNAEIFKEITEDKDIEIIYQATDDFENVVTKQITVKVRDTSIKDGVQKYVRFIGRDFLEDDNGKLLSVEDGGLEKNSIWRKEENLKILRKALSKAVLDAETLFFTADELKKLKEMSPAN